MKKSIRIGWLVWLSAVRPLYAESDTPEMREARVTGVTVAQLMEDNLRSWDKRTFPGIHAWMAGEGKTLADLDKAKADDTWRKLDSAKLVRRNPDFWQLFYEVVPGDPGLAMLHAGASLAAGDADRAQVLLRLHLHRGDLDDKTRRILLGVMQHCGRFTEPSHDLVGEGIKLHDKGDYAAALAKYDEALRLWPLNGWAAYERGTTLRIRAGDDTAEVAKAFEDSRRMQPFQSHAWQGETAKIPGMLRMMTEMPSLWEPSLKDITYVMKPEDLERMSEILQEAEVDDLALVTRQIFIFRRGRYAPEDHPFISKSLRRLVPGEQAEITIEKLAGSGLSLAQILNAPVPGKSDPK